MAHRRFYSKPKRSLSWFAKHTRKVASATCAEPSKPQILLLLTEDQQDAARRVWDVTGVCTRFNVLMAVQGPFDELSARFDAANKPDLGPDEAEALFREHQLARERLEEIRLSVACENYDGGWAP